MIQHNKEDQRNLIIAAVLAGLLIFVWQIFYEAPKRAELARYNAITTEQKKAKLEQQRATANKPVENETKLLPRAERLAQSPRLIIDSPKLKGSLSLKGLRLDDLTLPTYTTELNPSSPPVRLLSPAGDLETYFMQIGWLPGTGETAKMPGADSLWRADNAKLTPEKPVILSWENGEGLRFFATLSLDKNYMFTVRQRVENKSGQEVKLSPYALVNRAYVDGGVHNYILHEGPLGSLDGTLSEVGYKDLREKGEQRFESAHGWLGFTDKYWLTALAPAEPGFAARFDFYESKGQPRYQAEYTGAAQAIAPNDASETSLRFFAGAKELTTLTAYADSKDNSPIPLFDRAIDFGYLYFLTKPMMKYLLVPFYHLTGNFGIAILLLTIVVKGLMFPLANKGYIAATKMRALQPKMEQLRVKNADDKLKMQQDLMALYKKEKVNPAAGCLPILIQIPVFFALYKVLFVTIEMRHAPFFGWLKDLSAPDPSNIFNAFGLIPWTPPDWLHLGVLPILMGITMIVQMKQQPKPTDPVQAKMMTIMPYFFTILLAKMPAGLVLYWTWSNILSILQQGYITRRFQSKHGPAKTAHG